MKKTSIGALSLGFILLMTGCSTVPTQRVNTDKEPLLVGKPINERIEDSKIEIYDQLTLLENIKSGKKVGAYNVVQHNNDLDARRGSDLTVPQSYANYEDVKRKEEENRMQQVVKKIEWKNNSLNALSETIAKAIGYEIVVKTGKVSDVNITLIAENKTIQEIVSQLQHDLSSIAEIVLVPQNKTFNIIYK